MNQAPDTGKIYIKTLQLISPEGLANAIEPVLAESPILSSDTLLSTSIGEKGGARVSDAPTMLYARRSKTFAPPGYEIHSYGDYVLEGVTRDKVLEQYAGTGWVAEVIPVGDIRIVDDSGFVTAFSKGVEVVRVMCVRRNPKNMAPEILKDGILIRSEKDREMLLPITEEEARHTERERVYGRFHVRSGSLFFSYYNDFS